MKKLMKNGIILAQFVFVSASGVAQAHESLDGFKDESEAGVVMASGNTRSNTFNFKQKNTYGWNDRHLLRFDGAYLNTSSFGTESARSYLVGLRLEQKLSEAVSIYLGQNLESDRFAGYLQRYNSDLGAKVVLIKEDALKWNAESGYRYTVENRTAGDRALKSFLRLYSELIRDLNKNVSSKLSVEYLPNISSFADYRFNSELSLAALLNDTFSIKTGYLLRFVSQPPIGITIKTDTIFSTALVAKF